MTRRIHRLAGLFALGWLAVLSVTGIVLTHPEWRWPHRVIVPGLTAPQQKLVQHGNERIPHFASDPYRADRWIVGGVAGMWAQAEQRSAWTRVAFDGLSETPQVFRLLQGDDLTTLWIATDDGIWQALPGGRAARVALAGKEISALDLGSGGAIVAVVAQTRVVRVDPRTGSVRDIDVAAAPITGLPDKVSVNRWGFDLHLGLGFFPIPVSRFVNDIAGIAMVVLAVTGLLYWWLPRRWKAKGKAGPSGAAKRKTLVWLFRSHAVISGVVVFVPLVYLSATGVFLDHKLWFQSWSPQLVLPARATTGNYTLATLDREILGLATFPDRPDRIVLLTRLGFIESNDGGRSFSFDRSYPLDLATGWTRLRYMRVGDAEIAGELIGRNYWRSDAVPTWTTMPKLPGYVPLSATQLRDGQLAMRTYAGIANGVTAGSVAASPLPLPDEGGLDLTYLCRTIHGLLIFDKRLIWFNDAVAIASVVLMLTGLYNWMSRNRKWG